MQIQDIIAALEKIAPGAYQEHYDNAGLLTGNDQWECTGVLISLDATEAVIAEAIAKKCNLVVAHHPIVFTGLKKITGKNYVEQTVITAIKNDIAIFAIHTNLDNVKDGVNYKIAQTIGLQNVQILQPRAALLKKLAVFVPSEHATKVRDALFAAGAGNIGKYSECSFTAEGKGSFKAGESADPFVGEKGKLHEENEIKIEVVFPAILEKNVLQALNASHPYEEVAFDVWGLDNLYAHMGSGMIGTLPAEMDETAFLRHLQKHFNLKVIRHTPLTDQKVKKVAVCGGAGIFLLKAAKAAGANVFVTADVKYHEFFDAESAILLADIGHYESEQFTIDLLFDILSQNFPNFAVLKTGVNTNPVQYFL